MTGRVLDTDEPRELPPPSDPMAAAKVLVAERYQNASGQLELRYWRGGWWHWKHSHWAEVEHPAIRRDAYAFTENAIYVTFKRPGVLEPKGWEPNRRKIADLLEAVSAVTHLDESVEQPGWLVGEPHVPIVACANGLLDVESRQLRPHTPDFFNQTSVPFEYAESAPPPTRWLQFLDQLWPDDSKAIAALCEWFGYVVSGRLDLHKILLLVGPTRAGKGVIARILGALIGPRNVAGPTLSSLSHDFGLAPLFGKPLAVISDARLDSRTNTAVVVERLLAISGEDWLTVNRKYKEQWTGQLPTRFLVVSNELPRLGDASQALVNRFVVLQLQRSFLGEEDHGLEQELREELPGILNWSLEGLDRLGAQDQFTRPPSTDDALIALQDLASPVAAFVRERCIVAAQAEVAIDDLFRSWRAWAEANGQKAGTAQTFGRNLRAVVPSLRVHHPRDGDLRARHYRGIGLYGGDSRGDRVPPRAGGASAAVARTGTR